MRGLLRDKCMSDPMKGQP